MRRDEIGLEDGKWSLRTTLGSPPAFPLDETNSTGGRCVQKHNMEKILKLFFLIILSDPRLGLLRVTDTPGH